MAKNITISPSAYIFPRTEQGKWVQETFTISPTGTERYADSVTVSSVRINGSAGFSISGADSGTVVPSMSFEDGTDYYFDSDGYLTTTVTEAPAGTGTAGGAFTVNIPDLRQVEITSPQSSSVLEPGTDTSVSWDMKYVTTAVVEYSLDEAEWIEIAAPDSSGSTAWSVPEAEGIQQVSFRISGEGRENIVSCCINGDVDAAGVINSTLFINPENPPDATVSMESETVINPTSDPGIEASVSSSYLTNPESTPDITETINSEYTTTIIEE